MTYMLGTRSREVLQDVDPRMVAVVELAITKSSVDFRVLEGLRSVARQHKLYGQGRTAAQCKAAGVDPSLARPDMRQVTWTLKSRHFPDPRTGKSRAVDLLPAPYDWKDLKHFDAVALAMYAAAAELKVKIRWGADWDQDGNPRERGETDSPHFELAE